MLRISGQDTGKAVSMLTNGRVPAPRRAALRRLADPVTGETLDEALVLMFPAPASYTGEDAAELHVHGGRAVVAGVEAALAGLGLRPAEPGEFTRRAFLAGRLDLTRAEAIADLVAAETAAQRRQALRQKDGALGDLYDGWRAGLIGLMAETEAAIDFPDDDLPEGLVARARAGIAPLARAIAAHLGTAERGLRLRDGIQVAVLGAPNAGKSSIVNALSAREAAIVTPVAGTTRDVVEVAIDLAGYPVVLADTAGLRASDDPVEAEGVRRARARAGEADLRLAVLDATAAPAFDAETLALADPRTLLVVNKVDRARPAVARGAAAGVVHVSATTGEGMAELAAALGALVAGTFDAAAPAPTRLRHRRALEETLGHLDRAAAAALPELMAEDLRLAARALGRLTGRIDVEDVLDAVFRSFCIGK